ncbi:MAG: Crp/Fnr family transcriptional regulator [Roseivirga sp.]|nr:Crp/Fnr family transcriptional regulator [Roseivirga sp.]
MIPNQASYTELFKSTLQHYAPVSQASLEKLLAIARFRSIPKDQFLLHAGEVASRMYFVCEGILVSQYLRSDGSAHIKNFFIKGNFAASTVSCLQQSPSDFSIQCVEESVILDMSYHDYKELIFRYDDLKLLYINHLEQSWIIKNEKRQIAFATQTASERYRTFLNQNPDLETRVPQHQIASYLGITPTQLSRIRKEL